MLIVAIEQVCTTEPTEKAALLASNLTPMVQWINTDSVPLVLMNRNSLSRAINDAATYYLSCSLRKRESERERMKVLAVLVGVWLALALAEVKFQHPEEWHSWKAQHGKSYGSQREELERHLMWLSNREYINAHNANSEVFGFTLAMNHLGDMVSVASIFLSSNHYFQNFMLLSSPTE